MAGGSADRVQGDPGGHSQPCRGGGGQVSTGSRVRVGPQGRPRGSQREPSSEHAVVGGSSCVHWGGGGAGPGRSTPSGVASTREAGRASGAVRWGRWGAGRWQDTQKCGQSHPQGNRASSHAFLWSGQLYVSMSAAALWPSLCKPGLLPVNDGNTVRGQGEVSSLVGSSKKVILLGAWCLLCALFHTTGSLRKRLWAVPLWASATWGDVFLCNIFSLLFSRIKSPYPVRGLNPHPTEPARHPPSNIS